MNRRSRNRSWLAALAALTAVVVVSGAGASPRLDFGSDKPVLLVVPGNEAIGTSITIVPPLDQPLPGSIALSVPPGYTFDLPAPGKLVGLVLITLLDRSASLSATNVLGDLVAQDPSQYSADPCDPGAHAAVWLLTTSVVGRPVSLPVFVDVPSDGSAAYLLRLCPQTAFGSEATSSLTLAGFSLILLSEPTRPTAPGRYVWSAFVTPPGGVASELRAVLVLPQRLTLHARLAPKRHRVTLTGTYTVQGRPRAGATVSLEVVTHSGDKTKDSFDVAEARTSTSGAFTFKLPVKSTSLFSVSIEPTADPCEGVSAAPGGCLSSTTIGPDAATARVEIRRATDARLAVRSGDQRRAVRIGLSAADLPGWESEVDIDEGCNRPKESDLTLTGESRAAFYKLEQDQDPVQFSYAATHVRVFTSADSARSAFKREATLARVRCFVRDLPADVHATLKPRSLPRLAPDTRAFRITIAFDQQTATLDIVFLRRGRVLSELDTEAVNTPATLATALARKIAARMR